MPHLFHGRPVAVLIASIAACVAFAAPAVAQKRVLYVDYVHPQAHSHPSRANARVAMTALAQSSGGGFTVTMTDTITGLDAAFISSYDAIVFFTCGDMPADAPLRQALLDFVASGKGFVGFHSASDTAYAWPEYGFLLGARFVNHGSENLPGTIRVEDPNHVSMQGFTDPFTFTEEFYLFRGPEHNAITPFTRRDLNVLMYLDQATPTPARPTKQSQFPQLDDTYLPLAWTRVHGQGRVFYSALGHRPETWDNPQFRAHALAAIRWALNDGDNDGLADAWELSWGLRDYDAGGVNGAAGDADGDGRTNAQEQTAGTHPRGFAQRYLAEGATSTFFETRISVLNPNPTFTSRVQLRYQKDDGTVATSRVTLDPQTRRTITPPDDAQFSTLIESDQAVVAERTMTWSRAGRYGSHAESALTTPALDWYFAEGATGIMDLFYLVQNPNDQAVELDARFLRASGAPIARHYTVQPHSRLTINADLIPGLESAEVAAEFHGVNSLPIILERAMYLSRPGELWSGGLEGAGVTALSTDWFLAEGATGTFFNTYVLLANPGTTTAQVRLTFQRPGGAPPIERFYGVAGGARVTVGVAEVTPELAATTMSIVIHSTNAVPIVAERAMWWPGGGWYEGHATVGTNTTGTAWAVADGENGGAYNTRTYLLVASGASATADSLRVRAIRDTGPPLERIYQDALLPNARLTVDLGEAFPTLAGERVGVILESMGQTSSGAVTPMPIVVERAMYSDAGGTTWAAGTNLVATRLR